ncbi:putative inorganic phosphate cotransporter isoform X2 [Aethina tumida]|uniref:putative inorganic phosphate cotransporter isoform X2 n=1 Tax=Aethina tumida TaxID=116153 RepID=UPI00214816EF|nr:putative inorganic phosphate cotransporter isoform X2 [Aethina tumida]
MSKETLEMNNLEKGKANSVETVKEPTGWFGARHLQVLLNFLLVFIAYGIRVNLSVGIVAMTDPKASPNPEVPTYPEWHDKSIALSSFFWGYIIPQIGAGMLANKYGPKWFLVITMFVCSLFSVLIPPMADLFGSKGVMVCRAIQGFSQGFIFPSIHNLLSKWVPASERSRMGSFVYAGGSLGSVISMIVSGIMASSWYGWPIIFYSYGGIGISWAILMAIYGSNSPAEHKTISPEERKFIEHSLGHEGEKKTIETPWSKILTSLPVWAVLVAHCGQNWGFWTLITEIPSYMGHVMKFDIKSNSLLSALPYFVLWLLSFIFSAVADLLIVRNICSIGVTRKILNTIGLCVPAIALVFLGLGTESTNVSIALLVIAVSTNSAIYSGFNVNHIDLSPNHSGTLMGLTNCVSNIFSLLAPLMVQIVVSNEDDASEWRIVFFIAAAVYVGANTFFVIFGQGEVQSWNDCEDTGDNKEEKMEKYSKRQV